MTHLHWQIFVLLGCVILISIGMAFFAKALDYRRRAVHRARDTRERWSRRRYDFSQKLGPSSPDERDRKLAQHTADDPYPAAAELDDTRRARNAMITAAILSGIATVAAFGVIFTS